VKIDRVYFVCRQCKTGAHPLDDRLGVTGSISPQGQRLLCLAGGSWSFDCAAKHLQELCGVKVSDNTVRAVCQQQGKQMATWQREAREAREPFQQASGDIEFTTDGTMVNTQEGWREMRLGIFAKRPRGKPATADEWRTRTLPTTTVRLAFAAIEKSERFGARWGCWAARLGIRDTSQVSVLADGARWIWEQTSMHLGGATEVLDIYHGLERVSQTSHVLYGEGSEAAKSWADQVGGAMIAGGWPAVAEQLAQTKKTVRRKAALKALNTLDGYLGRQPEHLRYRERLAEGRAIGSGQAEGACKHMIGRRLKQTGARWRVQRVNRMAGLCCLMYSDHWDAYWRNN
jgi:hypothetical protein